MINTEVINEIYKKYDKRPASVDNLNLALLFEMVGIEHDILIDPDTEEMTIGSVAEDSPFRTLRLKNIHAIVPFEEWTAIVLHSSILFLNNKRPQVSIHIKQPELSLWERIKNVF